MCGAQFAQSASGWGGTFPVASFAPALRFIVVIRCCSPGRFIIPPSSSSSSFLFSSLALFYLCTNHPIIFSPSATRTAPLLNGHLCQNGVAPTAEGEGRAARRPPTKRSKCVDVQEKGYGERFFSAIASFVRDFVAVEARVRGANFSAHISDCAAVAYCPKRTRRTLRFATFLLS